MPNSEIPQEQGATLVKTLLTAAELGLVGGALGACAQTAETPTPAEIAPTPSDQIDLPTLMPTGLPTVEAGVSYPTTSEGLLPASGGNPQEFENLIEAYAPGYQEYLDTFYRYILEQMGQNPNDFSYDASFVSQGEGPGQAAVTAWTRIPRHEETGRLWIPRVNQILDADLNPATNLDLTRTFGEQQDAYDLVELQNPADNPNGNQQVVFFDSGWPTVVVLDDAGNRTHWFNLSTGEWEPLEAPESELVVPEGIGEVAIVERMGLEGSVTVSTRGTPYSLESGVVGERPMFDRHPEFLPGILGIGSEQYRVVAEGGQGNMIHVDDFVGQGPVDIDPNLGVSYVFVSEQINDPTQVWGRDPNQETRAAGGWYNYVGREVYFRIEIHDGRPFLIINTITVDSIFGTLKDGLWSYLMADITLYYAEALLNNGILPQDIGQYTTGTNNDVPSASDFGNGGIPVSFIEVYPESGWGSPPFDLISSN